MTTNKNLSQPAFNSASWDVPLNANFGYIDLALGGTTALNVTGASGTIALTSTQYTPLILSITGTLTANVNYQIPASVGGQWIVANAATGAFSVTISSGGGGFSVVIAPGETRSLYSNGTSVLYSDNQAFPTGTVMLFAQTSAPLGWTKSVSHNNKALRVVSGTASSGGSVAFTTAFSSQSVSGTVAGTALTEAQLPAHTHGASFAKGYSITPMAGGGGAVPLIYSGTAGSNYIALSFATGSTGTGGTHTHTFSGTSIDLAVSYVDVILATKD